MMHWRWLAVTAALFGLAWMGFARLRVLKNLGELRLAQREIARSQLEPAYRRLKVLAATPGALDGAADYWLGVCEALANRPDAALEAFGRLPASYPFDNLGGFLEARASLARGKLRAAERRLEEAMARGGPELDRVRDLLSHIYQMQARFRDAKLLLRTSLPRADNPIPILREMTNFELDRLPYDGLRAALEKAGELAPDEERVWLGKGRLAIESGRWDEARDYLNRCLKAQPDAPVYRAWIELAEESGRPDEALDAVRRLDAKELELSEQFRLRALLHKQRGDIQAEILTLEQWIELEPTATPAIERLTDLAQQAGRLNRVTELRRRKTEVEKALEAYRHLLWREGALKGATERHELGRRAEAAGRLPEARRLYQWALVADPDGASSREALSRLALTEAKQRQDLRLYQESWPSSSDEPPRNRPQRVEPFAAGLSFTDDAEKAGLKFIYDSASTSFHQLPEPFGGGVGLLDFDGDGWLDVYCVQGGPFLLDAANEASVRGSGDRLFHNLRDGRFEDVSAASGIARFPGGHGHGVSVGDVDGDGRPDLFVTRWRSYAFYRNKGDGTFEDITSASGLGGDRDWPTSAAFADFDGDGDLDLYVCHYAAWDLKNPRLCRNATDTAYLNCTPLDSPAMPDHLFRNDRGRFVDVTAEAGIRDIDGRGLGVVAADFDDDGKTDLFIANDSSANFLFRNLGGMRFEEIGHAAGVAGNASGAYQAGMGVAAGDLDGDGIVDLAVTNFYGESTTFYRNFGGCNFTDATAAVGLGVASRRLLGFGVALFDANNDGRLDLASVNGHVNDVRPNYPYQMPAQLLVGGADGRLHDVSSLAGLPWSVPRMGRGLAVGDLDNDGLLDLLMLSHDQPMAYVHNKSVGTGRSVTLQLAGRRSNRDGVGARVIVSAGGRRLVRQRVGGGSYQSASEARLHFGLGSADLAQSVEVHWPSGTVDRYLGVPADHAYLLIEGESKPIGLPGIANGVPGH